MYTRVFTINIPGPQVTVERYQPKHLAKKPPRRKNTHMRWKQAEMIMNRVVNAALSFAIIFAITVCFSSMSLFSSNAAGNIVPSAKAAEHENSYNTQNIAFSTVTEPAVTIAPEIEIPVTTCQPMDIPDNNSGQKTFMDYTAITDVTSRQYAMQQNAYTNQIGLRCYDSCYMIAMGTYYGDIGDRFQITFASGTTITAIMGDVKDDKHTDIYHQHRDGNIVEFIVDGTMLPDDVWYHGDISYLDDIFEGKIVSIKKLITPETGL